MSADNLGLSPMSTLLLMLLLLDLLLPSRTSLGSVVGSPLALANRIKMSVRLTTPTRCPLILAPGMALADIEGPAGAMKGDAVEGGGW